MPRDFESGHARNNPGEQEVVTDTADGEHLDPVDGAGDRRAENTREPGADPTCEQAFSHFRIEVKHAADAGGEARTDMGAWSFLARGTTTGEGDQGCQRLDPQRAERHAPMLLVDRDDGAVE